MNLIEQLGGYECAKAEYDDPMYEDGELYTIKATGARFFKHNLADELLQYRRQHNIFEVGDKVVFIESELKNPRLMTVIEVSEPVCGFLMAECSLGITNGFYPSRYRHATDEEIKAGKRLEVN